LFQRIGDFDAQALKQLKGCDADFREERIDITGNEKRCFHRCNSSLSR
jgi:hypothetical protein